ncbi:MAG: MarR family transcriptional regulator [Marmoricola sp.]
MTSESHWLSDTQQQVWRRWLATNALLPGALHRELQADAGLSLPDFHVLVQLTESPEARVRVTDLARTLTWERSRLSHHVTRMEKRGLVNREECPDDGRGAFVTLTAEGRATIERAAPAHALTVRSLVFDQLSEQEIDILGSALDKVLARLDPAE